MIPGAMCRLALPLFLLAGCTHSHTALPIASDVALCLRGPGGVLCASWDGTGFGRPALWSSAFADAQWANSPPEWATIQMPNLDSDGRPDICGRDAGGLVCALRNAKGGGPAAGCATRLCRSVAGGDPADAKGRGLGADKGTDGLTEPIPCALHFKTSCPAAHAQRAAHFGQPQSRRRRPQRSGT